MFNHNTIWYGSDESCFSVLQAQDKVELLQSQGTEALKAAILTAGGGRGSDPFELPSLWEAHGPVAVLSIKGSLVAGNAGFARLFGIIGYQDISNAAAEIALDKNIKTVVMDVDSGGGQVDGLEDAGNDIRRLDAIKPVLSYTGGMMGSAAYWLGSSARSVAAAKTAQVGSIGTIIMHMERSKMLQDMGIKATVVRYGKFKALANPVEPLSEAGQKELETMAADAGKIFVEYAADRRGTTPEKFQATAGEGRVFMGQKAMDVGLVDHVTNMSDAINLAKSLDKSGTQSHNSRIPGKAINMKLSKKTILAIAACTAVNQLGLAAPDANLQGIALEGDALTLATAEATEIATAFKASTDSLVTAAVAPLTKEIGELTSKLAAAESAKTTAEAATQTFQTQLKDSSELAASGFTVMKASMSTMSVALGGAAGVGDALTGKELVAAHEALAEKFTAKFPSGGVAAVTTTAKPSATAADSNLDAQFLALSKNAAPAK